MTNFTLTILFFLSLFTAPSDELKDNVHLAESVEVMESNLVITEIMYNPNSVENRWEWIEVYNKGLEPIDLSGYVLDDNNNSEQGAANILAGSIPPKSTAILFDADISLEHFTEVWGDVNAISVVGWPGLNNPGDSIGLWDSFESYDGDNTSQVNVIEQVIYENGGDWPESDNAGSIFLIALDFDNTLGSNWSLSIDAIETPLGTASSSQNLHENTGLDIGSPNPIVEEEDTTQPIIECPEMVEINNNEGQCSSEVPLLEPRATDNVSTAFIFNAERSDGLVLEDPFPTGDTMITWTATDEANNTSLPCVQLISVIDRELPTAIAQNMTIELDEDGMATIFPEELDNVETPSFDNCGIATYSASRTEFNCADLEAPVQVEFSVVDANGNTSTETNAFITVVDKLKPIMACNADIITISSNGNPIILEDVTEPLVSDNCDEAPLLSFSRSDQQELNAPFDVGATTITWQAVDAVGNVSMCVQTILVDFTASMDNDIIAFSIPEQVGETVIDVEAKAIDVLMPLGTDVTDLRPSFVVSESASSSPEIGEAVDFTEAIFYSITAQDGSVQEWIVTVTLEEDITPPTFLVNGKTEDFVTELEVGDTYIVGEISNIVDESITSSEILGDDLVNTTIEGGPFLVSYSVSDGSNVSTITETVTVVTQMQPAPSILSFTLVNSDTNEDLFPLEEGMEISIAELPTINLNIRANASDDTQSVALSLSGDKITSRTENVFPFALYGDSPTGNYKGSEFGLGSYTVSSTAYTEGQLVGDSGEELSLNFQIIEVQRPFVTTWKTNSPGVSEDNQVTIPIDFNFSYDYDVDWGDGNSDSNVTGVITHTYQNIGTYEISISGNFPTIRFRPASRFQTDAMKLLFINQWGDIEWASMSMAFNGCQNMDMIASDTPDLSKVEQMNGMFSSSGINGNDSFNRWDTSHVRDLSGMFTNTTFNQDISDWDVSKVTTLNSMFALNGSFNQDISRWDVSQVVDVAGMFHSSNSFNQPMASWDVSKIINMNQMFSDATSFNQDITGWDVSSMETASGMFEGGTSFNQNIGLWKIQNATDLSGMFFGGEMPKETYDAILLGWSAQNLQNGVTFDGGNSQFCLGEESRQKLIDDFGWAITDGGKSEECVIVEAPADLIAATYLQGAANPNPTGPILRTEEGNRETYLKFNLSAFSGPITNAQLKMQVASDPGFGTLEVYLGSDSNWTETGLNGANKPTIVGEAIAVISGTHSLGETKIWDLDVSQISNNGLITLIVKHSNGNDVAFASDETDQAPELIITSGSSGLVDADGDGFYNDVDCDDDNSDVHPDAVEICDGIDNNCDGLIDEADPAVTCGVTEVSADLIDATYLQGAANPNPTGPILRAEDGIRETYLKFDMGLLNGAISEAQLEILVASDPGFGILEVFLGSHSNWTESGLNGSNKPTITGNALASISGTHSLGQTKTWTLDISEFPNSGFITLIVKHSNGNDVAFASDESNQPPKLILSVEGANEIADELSAKSRNALSMSPNPASVETKLIFKEPTAVVKVYVYDVLGRLMGCFEDTKMNDNGVLNVQSLSAGTYYIKAFDADGKTYQKQLLIKK